MFPGHWFYINFTGKLFSCNKYPTDIHLQTSMEIQKKRRTLCAVPCIPIFLFGTWNFQAVVFLTVSGLLGWTVVNLSLLGQNITYAGKEHKPRI